MLSKFRQLTPYAQRKFNQIDAFVGACQAFAQLYKEYAVSKLTATWSISGVKWKNFY